MIEFPKELPLPLLDGFSVSNRETTLRTQMSSGFSRQRRAYEYVPPIVNASWVLKADQVVIFEAWYRAINSGADWFEILFELPTGKSYRAARFSSVYAGPEPYGHMKYWKISMQLELRDLPTFSGDDYLYDPMGIEYADVFDIVVNNWLPA